MSMCIQGPETLHDLRPYITGAGDITVPKEKIRVTEAGAQDGLLFVMFDTVPPCHPHLQ